MTGLPRGICLSASMSEIVMRDYDTRISRLQGVYYYARYVDDIVVFTHRNPCYILKEMEKILQEEVGLKFNPQKTDIVNIVTCRCKPKCKCIGNCQCLNSCQCSKKSLLLNFEFLGYKFTLQDVVNPKEPLQISLAENKVKRYKTRIIYSILDYITNADISLLEKRIAYLTGNHIVKNNSEGAELKAGIFYSYPYINNYKILDDLTLFLRKAINAKEGAFGKKIGSCIKPTDYQRISKYCFRSGYLNRKEKVFSASEVRLIQRCWKYGKN